MIKRYDYSAYECPFAYIEKDYEHKLHGPESFDTDSIWCECGFRGPAFINDPEKLKLKKRVNIGRDRRISNAEGEMTTQTMTDTPTNDRWETSASLRPLRDVVNKLIDATDILLDEKSYDEHGYELIHEARAHARVWVKYRSL